MKVGGRHQLTGNAGGIITRCDPPDAFDVTAEVWVALGTEIARGKRGRKHAK